METTSRPIVLLTIVAEASGISFAMITFGIDQAAMFLRLRV